MFAAVRSAGTLPPGNAHLKPDESRKRSLAFASQTRHGESGLK
jgi:tetrahydromethanopterin S-methyltransferase subunit C